MRRAAVVALALATPSVAGADERLSTDLAVSVAAGVDAGKRTKPAGEARFLYMTMAGAYGRLTEDVRSVGIEARPLALPRLLDASDRSTFGDLLLGSTRLSLGAAFGRGGRALEVGAGFDVPLLGRFAGPFVGVDGLYRAPSSRLDGTGKGEARAFLVLGWRFAALSHVVDAGDRSSR